MRHGTRQKPCEFERKKLLYTFKLYIYCTQSHQKLFPEQKDHNFYKFVVSVQTFRLSHYFTDRRRLLRHKQFHKPTLLEEYELVQTCFQVNARKMFERKILSTRRDGLKVDEPYSYTLLIGTPIFEWCVIGYGSKNGYKRDTCLKEIG